MNTGNKVSEDELRDITHKCWLDSKKFYQGKSDMYFFDYYNKVILNTNDMRKLIDIKTEDVEPLKILAVKANKDLKNYIQDLLTEHAQPKE